MFTCTGLCTQFTMKNALIAQFLLTTAQLLTQNSHRQKVSVLNFQVQWQMETYCDDLCCKGASTFLQYLCQYHFTEAIEKPAEICQMETHNIPDVAQRNEYKKSSSNKISRNFILTDKPHKRGGQREKNTLLRSYSVLAEMYGLVCRDYQSVSKPPKTPGRIPCRTAVLCVSEASCQAFFVAVHFLLNNYKTRKPNSCFTCAMAG